MDLCYYHCNVFSKDTRKTEMFHFIHLQLLGMNLRVGCILNLRLYNHVVCCSFKGFYIFSVKCSNVHTERNWCKIKVVHRLK